jgi:filamentous hemagglutinin family protein
MSRLLAWLLSALLGSLGMAHAQINVNTLPMGGRVVVGSGQVQQGSNTLVITQATPKLGMDWQSFNIGSGALVEFVQPGADSVALNRVVGNSGSEIYGRLRANGQVFLVNPAGILFAPGAKVDVGGLVASTLDLSQQDFAEGRYTFSANAATGRSAVVNQGELRANAGGYIALFGNRVDNQGTVQVDSGSVVLASGRAATVSISGSGLISAVVTAGDTGSVSNSGSLLADGGVVTMSAQSADGVARSLVNNSGIIRANTLVERNGEVWITGDDVANSGQISARSEGVDAGAGAGGRIMLLANMQSGTAQVGGALDASSAGGDGGFIETSAARVKVASDAQVTTAAPKGRTGTWLIDPTDFTVAATGGDLTGAQLSTQLANTSVNIATIQNGTGGNGDIFVNDTVSWGSGSTLTLTADRNIAINAAVTASGSGRLALEYARSVAGGTYRINAPVVLPGTGAFTTKQGSNNPISYTALSASDLQNFESTPGLSLTGNYMLVGDINLGGQAFNPIGNQASTTASTTNSFSGRFEGLGHTVSGLAVSAATNGTGGLFASTTGSARISNLTLAGTVNGTGLYVGGLVGLAGGTTTLDNITSSVDVSSTATGSTNVGGIAGRMTGGTISNSSVGTSSSRATVSGAYAVGGVVGQNLTATLAGNAAQVNVSSGGLYAGGIAGSSTGAISNATVGGSISSTANAYAGGVVGQITGASITASTSSASVSSTISTSYVGGLAGESNNTITNSSASGAVSGGVRTGGLVGHFSGSLIDNGSATGNVDSAASAPSVGGLVGYMSAGSLSNATASGNVTVTGTGASDVGGLVGTFNASTGSVSSSSATGNVNGGQSVGGLIGTFTPSGSTGGNISNSFATGNVTATVNGGDVGGLIGLAQSAGAVTNSYARGNVAAPTTSNTVGGLVGNLGMTGGIVNSQAGAAGSQVSGGTYTGGVAGFYNSSVALVTDTNAGTSVVFSGASVSGGSWVGGIVGYSNSAAALSGLSSSASVSATSNAGGIAGRAGGNVSNLAASGAVSGGGTVGGAIGVLNGSGTVSGSQASGAVSNTGTSGSAGGLIGSASMSGGTIGSSTATGAVSGGGNGGGLIGDASSLTLTVDSSFNSTTAWVTASGTAGGVVGTMSNSSLGGAAVQRTVTGSTAGGAVGVLSTSSVSNSSSSAQVTGVTYAGGLVGRSTGTSSIADSSSSAPVTANAGNSTAYAGGLLGYSDSYLTIARNTATGNVLAVASSANAGGLVGYIGGYSLNNSTPRLTDNVARGHVSIDASSGSAGGLVGYTSYSGIARSDAYGSVTSRDSTSGNSSSFQTGGLVGQFDGPAGVGITSSNAYGNVAGRYYTGGLVGYYSSNAYITGSTARGTVSGTTYTGGLVGFFSGSSLGGISNSSATGSVSGTSGYTGGLVAYYSASNPLNNVSASGDVTGTGSAAGGLVGYIDSTGITTGFASGKVNGSASNVGGLVGYFNYTSNSVGITDSRATGSVSTSASSGVGGGLVGFYYNYYGTSAILNSTAEGNVTTTGSSSTAGGLVGSYQRYATTGVTEDIRGSFASGAVSAGRYAGGLVGDYQGTAGIRLSGATGSVTLTGASGSYAGGLVGRFYAYASTAQIDRSWASGDVGFGSGVATSSFGTAYMGGLVGQMYGGAAANVGLTDAYATGKVNAVVTNGGSNATLRVGGLVGETQISLQRSYATGAVTYGGFTTTAAGGLVGRSANTALTVGNSFWATDSTGQATSDGGTGQTLSQLKELATFPATGNDAWSIASTGSAGTTWRIYEGFTTPLLAELLTPASVALADTTKVYDGTTSFGNGVLTGSGGPITRPDLVFVSALSPNVGTYTVAAANIYSSQRGYDLSVSGSAQLSITPRPLTLAGVVADKVYDGTRLATLTGGGQPTGLVAGEDLLIDGSAVTAVFDTKDVGTNKTVTVSGYTLGDGVRGLAANYSIGANTVTTASITPKALTGLSFTATDRAYDGSTAVQVAVSGGALQGVISGDDVTPSIGSSATGSMADKNVGSNKPVVVSGGALSGADAGNYVIGGTGGVTVNITQKDITVNGLTADNRAYNANTNVTVRTGGSVLTGLVPGDIVQLANTTLTGQVADKNVDTAKAVTVTSIGLRGPDAQNYRAQGGGLTVDITPANLSWFAYPVTGTNRLYDGTATATVGIYLYSYGNDNVALNIGQSVYVNGTGAADKNVVYNSNGTPTSKSIVVSVVNGNSLTGTDARNYTLSSTSSTTSGVISPIPLSVTGVTAVDRAYNGSTAVDVNVSNASVDLSRKVTGDDLGVQIPTGGSGTVTGTMVDKNVGTNKPVNNIQGLALTGNDRQNYTLTGTNGVTVNIARKDLTASYTGIDRAYDGSNIALVQASSTDIVQGDNVDFYSNVLRGYYYYYGCYYYCAQFTGTGAKDVGQNKPIAITSDTLTGNDAGNYRLVNATTGTATASVTPKDITVQFNGVNKVYDGTTTAQVSLNTSSSGIYSGDAVAASGSGVFADKNVAYTSGGAVTSKTVAVSGIGLTGTDAFNYNVLNSTGSTTATITPKAVTLTGITPQDRSYDGTTAVAVTAGTVTSSGFVTGDTVSVQQPSGGLTSGTVADKNVGTSKPVTVTGLSLAGADAGNYSIDLAGSGLTVNITGKDLTVAYTGINKVYDGGTAAQVTATSADLLSGDAVGFTQSAIFTGIGARNVGTGKAIGVSNIRLTGADAANYTLLNTTARASADITPKGITVTYTGLDRVYNGAADLSALVQGASNGLIAGDIVGFTQQAQFQTDGRAGNGKAVDVTAIALTGTNAANYSLLNSTATTTANITRKAIGVTGFSALDRTYDGTTQVQISVSNAQVDTSGIVGQDQVSVVLPSGGITTGTLRNGKNAGQGKAVDVSGLSITGTDAANYQVVGAAGLTVNIAALAVNASFSALDKVYDGSAVAQVSGSSSGFLAIDAGLVSVSATGAFEDKNAGSNKTVTVSNAFLAGAERANYTLINTSGQTTASISRKTITPLYSGGTRVYDGTTTAVVNASPTTGIVAGDQVGFSQTALFSGTGAKNVAYTNGGSVTSKPVDVSNIFVLGADAANYQLSSTTASTTATITPKPITVSGLTNVTAQDRTYDGTRVVTVVIPANANIAANSSDIVGGDDVTIAVPSNGTTTGSMANKAVGTNKAVLVDGLGLSGADSRNYTITGTAGITVNISQKPLTASYVGVDKVYDGSVSATATGTSADVVSGDAVTIRGSGQFTGTDARNAGTGKPVSVSSATLSGADAGNYALQNASGSTTANITQRGITPSFSGGSRVYDGSTAAPVTDSTSNFVRGDAVSLTSTATFADKDVAYNGSGAVVSKAVTVSGITLVGADAANYQLLSTSVTTNATITPKPLVLLGLSGLTAVNRVYDATRTVTVNINSTGGIAVDPVDLVGSDVVTVNAPSGTTTTGTVANKNAGIGKAVTVTGLTLSGADAGNYSIAATNGLTVTIVPRDLTATYSAANKIYDGSASASVSGTSVDVLGSDSVSVAGTGRFVDGKNAGTGKNVSVTAGRLTGTDAANYTLLNTTASTTADITQRDLTATFAGGTRVYDGSMAAPVTGTLVNLVANDRVVLGQTALFTDDKNVGDNKPVAINGMTLSGSDAGNYRLLTSTASTTASVTPRPLRLIGLTGVTASPRDYDGTTSVTVTVSSSTGTVTANPADLVAGDTVTVNAPVAGVTTGTLQDKNVGTAKPVSVTGLSLSGADAVNYSLQGTTGVTVDITPRPLTASYSALDRVYDGGTSATVTATSADRIAGDALVINAQGSFTGTGARNVGTAKAVAVTGGVLAGTDAGNYSLLNPTGSTTATIVARGLSISYLGGTRVYDATANANVTATLNGLVTGDDVQSAQTAVFAGGKDVAYNSNGTVIAKAVSINNIALAGADATNYQLLTTSASTTGTITPRALTVSGLSGITAVDRVYDGSLSVSLNVPGSLGSASGDALQGDQVAVVISGGGIGSGTLLDKNAGQNKSVVLTGLALSGADAGNYFIAGTNGLTVNIAPKTLAAVFTGVSRVYDGTAAAAVLGGSADIVAGDAVSLAATGVFTGVGAKNVGTGKAISISGVSLTGTDAPNYTLTGSTGSATADITPRVLTATYTGTTRVYDGSVAAPVTGSLGGLITGDDITLTENAVFTGTGARNVGTGKAVSVTAIALGGADAGNYSLAAASTTTTASVTPRPLTVTGLSGISAQDRVYDGTTAVAVNLPSTISGLSANVITGDDVTVTVSSGGVSGASMLDKQVGQNKPVVLNGLALSGADAPNYVIGGTLGLTVNITPRPLSITGVTAVDRVYDGLRDVAIDTSAGSLVGAIAGDDVRLPSTGVTGLMTDKQVGQNKAVTVSGLTLAGTDLPNYVVSSGAGLTVNIAQRTLAPAPSSVSKVYDGTTGATVTLAAANGVQGDDVSFTGSAVYASRNVGTGMAVAVSGLSLAGQDAANYQMAVTQLNTTGTINPRSLVITPDAASKNYGDSLTLSGTAFSMAGQGLVSGETLGSVTLSSAGTAATAAVQGSPYAITASNATGGTFDPANYAITYGSGLLTVRPRPVTVAANGRVLVAGNPLPALNSYGFSTSVDGLVGGDSLSSVTITPQGLTGTQAVGGYYSLQASNAVFGAGNASNYALSYATGLLVVLPPQPQVGDFGGTGGGGFAVTVTPQERQAALDALLTAQRSTSGTGSLRNRTPSTVAPLVNALQNLSADELALLLSGDSRKLNPADLLKLPLFTFDPELRRLMQTPEDSREAAPTN